MIDQSNLGHKVVELIERLKMLKLPQGFVPNTPWDLFLANELNAERISAVRGAKGNRVFTSVTGLSKLARTQLVADGYQLGSVDIICTQPTILVHAAVSYSRHRQMLGVYSDNVQPANRSELKTLIELCDRTQLYEWLLEHCRALPAFQVTPSNNRRFIVNPQSWGREDIKKQLAIAIFSKPANSATNPVFRCFDKHFPSFTNWLMELQNAHGYSAPAKLAQRIESDIVVNSVATDFITAFPEAPIATIHDEIIAPIEYLPWIDAKLTSAFSAIGISIQCRTSDHRATCKPNVITPSHVQPLSCAV